MTLDSGFSHKLFFWWEIFIADYYLVRQHAGLICCVLLRYGFIRRWLGRSYEVRCRVTATQKNNDRTRDEIFLLNKRNMAIQVIISRQFSMNQFSWNDYFDRDTVATCACCRSQWGFAWNITWHIARGVTGTAQNQQTVGFIQFSRLPCRFVAGSVHRTDDVLSLDGIRTSNKLKGTNLESF